MNPRTVLSIFIGFLLVVSLSSFATGTLRGMALVYVDVSVSQAKVMVDANPFLVVLDVRNQSEYDAGHVRNAKLIPLWQLSARLDELNMNDEILVYCMGGARSANASMILASNGFLHVYNMLEGINGWTAAGHPVYVKYPSIQAAINNATNAQTINLSSGLYYENLIVNKSLTLNGEEKYSTIIDGSSKGTVVSIEADNVTVTNLTIERSGCGCKDFAGVYVRPYHQNVNITDNRIIWNGFGVKLVWAQDVTTDYNEIANNNGGGIEILHSSDNTIVGNNVAYGYFGIDFNQSSNNEIYGNNITSNAAYGVRVCSSFLNTFAGNDFVSNTIGLDVQNSTDNRIYHNNFIGSFQQVHFDTSGLTNHWDAGNVSGGNFWDDFVSTDLFNGPYQNETGSDGIGDSHRVLDTSNRDKYPLMGMIYSFEFSQNGRRSELKVISNSTVTSLTIRWNGTFVYPNGELPEGEVENSILFNLSGPDGTAGFCRLTIPATLIDGGFIIYVDGVNTTYTLLPFSNSTDSFLYFTYPQSTHEIMIIPEFSSWIYLLLFTATVLLILVVYRKKQEKRT